MELMLVNPSKRGSKKMAIKRRIRVVRRKNPMVRKLVTPRRRAVSLVPRHVRSAQALTRVRRSRRPTIQPIRRRRNPAPRNMINRLVMPAITQAAGGLAASVLIGMPFIPDQLRTGPMRHIAKMGMGLALDFFIKGQMGKQLALGAVTIGAYDAAREMVQNFMPNINLGDSGMGYMTANLPDSGVGLYVPNNGGAIPNANPIVAPINTINSGVI